MDVLLPFILLFAMLASGVPVAFSLGIAGTVGLLLNIGLEPTLSIVATVPYRHGTSFLLTTVPMFLLMAELLSGGRLTRDIYQAMYAWFGSVRGGLAMATTVANGGMGAITGSSTASAASFASIAIPHMREYGYNDKLSAGSIAAAGTMAAIIPPSVALIIYGIATETSIGALFAAGLIPGVLTVLAYVLVIRVWVGRHPELAPRGPTSVSLRERLQALIRVWPALLLVVLVLGGIYSGAVTPTEAGALGATAALLLSVLFGGLRPKGVWRALWKTAQTTTMILTIVIFASIFGYFLTTTRVAPNIVNAIQTWGLPSIAVMLIIVLLYILLGTFMDQIAILLLTLPITFPLATSLGYDGIWFGILVIKLAEIGLVTPPLGLNVYVTVGAVPDVRLSDAFRGVGRFVLADLVLVVLLFAIPDIALFLPRLLL